MVEKSKNCVCKTSGASWTECSFPSCSCKHKVGYTTTGRCKHKVGYTTAGRGTLRTNTSDASCWYTCSRFLHSEVRDNERRCHHVTTKFIVGDTKSVLCVRVSSVCGTLKKTSFEIDRSRLAQPSVTSGRRRNNLLSKTTVVVRGTQRMRTHCSVLHVNMPAGSATRVF